MLRCYPLCDRLFPLPVQDKSAALDVLQRLTDLRISRVENTSERSRQEAEAWLGTQQASLAKAYDVVSACVASSNRWLRVWPLLHLWLSGEHASTQSIHASAEAQGLVGELLALSRYASVVKVWPSERFPSPLSSA